MAAKNEGSKIVEIKENETKKAPETADNNVETNNENEEKINFWWYLKHPIKGTKKLAKEHPVATGIGGTVLVGGLAFAGKCVIDALSGEDTEEDDEEEDEVLDDEEENDEDEI